MWQGNGENKPLELNLSVFVRRVTADLDPLWLYAVPERIGVFPDSARYIRRYMT